MKIITVRGAKDSGKTNLIRLVYQKILKNHGKLILYDVAGADHCDFTVIVNYNGKVIVIISCGDAKKWVKAGVEVAKNVKAAVLINALNTKLSEAAYRSCVHPDVPDFVPIDKKSTVEEMAQQEEDLCNQIFKKL